MKIIVSQNSKKILITFESGKVVDKYEVNKADDFLSALDKFLKGRDNLKSYISKADLKFVNTSILTERIIRAIIIGLRF